MIADSFLINTLGMMAGTLTTAGYIPQIVRCYQTKSAKDISYWMPILLAGGIFLWLLYGLSLHSWPIIVTNSVSFLCNLLILFLKFIYQ